jgi:hypothetical protein
MLCIGTVHDHFSEAEPMNCCDFAEAVGAICGRYMLQIFEQRLNVSRSCTVFKQELL